MKTKYVSKILGFGLSAGLVFASIAVLFVSPVAASEMEWGKVTTPSWADNVIEPGSDIHDYDVGPDGDTIIATGAVTSVVVPGDSVVGLSGGFAIDGSSTKDTISITAVTNDASNGVAEISGTFYGDAMYLFGNFTTILYHVEIIVPLDTTGTDTCVGTLVLTGEISGHPDAGDSDDKMTFSGYLYGNVVDDFSTATATVIGSATMCVNDWVVQPFTSGVVSVLGHLVKHHRRRSGCG